MQQATCITIYLLAHMLVVLTRNACINHPESVQIREEEVEEIQKAVASVWKRECLLYRYMSLWRKCRFELIVTLLENANSQAFLCDLADVQANQRIYDRVIAILLSLKLHRSVLMVGCVRMYSA